MPVQGGCAQGEEGLCQGSLYPRGKGSLSKGRMSLSRGREFLSRGGGLCSGGSWSWGEPPRGQNYKHFWQHYFPATLLAGGNKKFCNRLTAELLNDFKLKTKNLMMQDMINYFGKFWRYTFINISWIEKRSDQIFPIVAINPSARAVCYGYQWNCLIGLHRFREHKFPFSPLTCIST